MTARRRRLDWRPILLEAGFVVLGVVLALAANEWRRASNDRQSASLALESIREELAANRAEVLESARYHMSIIDTLAALRSRAGADPSRAAPATPDVGIFHRGFIMPAPLLHTAWDAAEATGAVRHMSFRDVLQLSRVYEEQEYYRRQTDQVGPLIYARLLDHGMQGVVANYANMINIISSFWYRECQLLRRLDELLGEPVQVAGATTAIPEQCARVPAR